MSFSTSDSLTSTDTPAGEARRRPGRPPGSASRSLDRQTVLAVAFSMTRTIPVNDLSIVRVARELGVTPPLIHYYLAGGGRDALTSGVMNAFYREVVERWPPENGDWRHNVEVVLESIYRAYLRYPGVSIYAASNNKYQLVQDVQPGEADYGLLMLEKFNGTVRQGGFGAGQCGALAHLLIQFVQSQSHSTVMRRWPGQHAGFLQGRLASLDPEKYPNCQFVAESLAGLNPAEAFSIGLRVMLDGLEAVLPR